MNDTEDTQSEHETTAPGHETDAPVQETNSLELSFAETRVLGCLLEKEATTPDQYPLTLNSLQSACNQSSNRDPVVSFDTATVEQALEDLRYNGLCMLVHQAGARVGKYKHTLDNRLDYLTEGNRALLCVLLLRGQQTTGELRQRTERMHAFADIAAVESSLQQLIDYDPFSLARKFPPGGGRRVASYAHCLSGTPDDNSAAAVSSSPSATQAPAAVIDNSPTWRETLETRVEGLETEVAELKSQLDQLRADLGA